MLLNYFILRYPNHSINQIKNIIENRMSDFIKHGKVSKLSRFSRHSKHDKDIRL